jgi:transcriptional regulator GlxA family with amidase domain
MSLLVLPDVGLASLAGPLEVFSRATKIMTGTRRSPAYRIELLTTGDVLPISGLSLSLVGGRHWTEAAEPIDTLLVLANANTAESHGEPQLDPELLAWLQRQAQRVRRIASVCAGAFVLAAAGILDGKEATTHWSLADTLAARYPHISVDGDRIYTKDGKVWTSAGVTAGTDLALAMVEEDYGNAVALEIARRMVVFLRRTGGQKQFSTQLAGQAADHQPIRELIAWMTEHLDTDLSVRALARRAGMSERNFSRVFTDQVGMTPARFVARLRMEAAQSKLAEGSDKIETVAQRVGFGNGEALRRRFQNEYGASPNSFRGKQTRAAAGGGDQTIL